MAFFPTDTSGNFKCNCQTLSSILTSCCLWEKQCSISCLQLVTLFLSGDFTIKPQISPCVYIAMSNVIIRWSWQERNASSNTWHSTKGSLCTRCVTFYFFCGVLLVFLLFIYLYLYVFVHFSYLHWLFLFSVPVVAGDTQSCDSANYRASCGQQDREHQLSQDKEYHHLGLRWDDAIEGSLKC